MFFEPTFLAIQFLNGLQLASLLFLLSVGLSVVYGLMNFINLAHGTLYMLGAYIGLTVARESGSFWLALVGAPLAIAALGALFHVLLLRRMQAASPMKQVLVTFGLIFIGLDVVRYIWGDFTHSIETPAIFSGSVQLLGEVYPSYRLFVIGLGLFVFVALYLGLERTRLGAVVRAGVDDREVAMSLGLNIELAFFIVFCLGCGLAGLAGVIAAPVLSVYPGMDMSILVLTLIVVVIGGPGSLKGAALGAFLIGMFETFGQVFMPALASVIIYALMAVVLLVRPGGLLPVRPG
ncbi:MAG: High-affinity branched-chain amino acid transport system permease protein LivH [Alphaproteobacteria bacterium MarineAlpha9_Bin5]|jgi:branched-chain amino acid transport system permease protein|nr:MAG: High-affinity branched-chain amino acid transport system permease protein LivH [Alphaproteobacteria bacterium MarineAlpha9_Bin6]PPR38655.1 MAG: High-affinity branched-chain amino acid transport system permease protein LivH [Alphaproteobacteria bacterium MarineAlpha9_Bin5]HHZ67002.1 branched-chain amino acid ABC transporter permease [Alphaproteobacteria bacterium]HIA21639.1 branched-chain amino acid ABC transporter permease [Alphaproteobacteria bacterium]HIB19588.1 branched-chain amino a